MSENKLNEIEDWSTLFYGDYDGGPTCTFIKPDGSLSEGKQIEPGQIDTVLYSQESDNDWAWNGEALVTLKDGHFAYLTAWNDTTFSDANHFIADSLETLYKYAMSPGEEETIRTALL